MSTRITYSDEEFVKRVQQRCQELGLSQREMLRQAKLAADTLQNTPTHGRRIDTYMKLAVVLDWSVDEVLGLPAKNRIDPDRNFRAIAIAAKAMKLEIDTLIFGEIQGAAYELKTERAAAGHPDEDDEYDEMLVGIFRTQVGLIARGRRRPR